eukprot:m.1030413 g.1030413  ORF g.1030413 m.1030413 type:complete len:100 (+) comp24118_c0_seq22:2279-2578(+)
MCVVGTLVFVPDRSTASPLAKDTAATVTSVEAASTYNSGEQAGSTTSAVAAPSEYVNLGATCSRSVSQASHLVLAYMRTRLHVPYSRQGTSSQGYSKNG